MTTDKTDQKYVELKTRAQQDDINDVKTRAHQAGGVNPHYLKARGDELYGDYVQKSPLHDSRYRRLG